MTTRTITPAKTAERSGFSSRVAQKSLRPLWEVFSQVLTTEPRVDSVPGIWRYADIRPDLIGSASLITAEEAERRVLYLQNPGLPGQTAVTESLYAGLQLIMPGEMAPPHRHSPSALRLFIEGDNAYTTVNGEQTRMYPGDLVLTPSWSWHGHGNEGIAPAIWLDILDMPVVRHLGAMFLDTDHQQSSEARPADDSLYRYGRNMRPVNETAVSLNSPVIRYPYLETRAALEKIRTGSRMDLCHGLKLEYTNPLSGEAALSTISTFIQLLPAGFKSELWQTTEGLIYSVIEGSGSVIIGTGENGVKFDWQAKDTFVIPCWYPHRFETAEESVLFSASDRVIQNRLGLWRERR